MWFYFKSGHQIGPVSQEVLQQLAAAGTLSQDDLVWQNEAHQFPAGTVSWLFPPAGSSDQKTSFSVEPQGFAPNMPSLPEFCLIDPKKSKRSSSLRPQSTTPTGLFIAGLCFLGVSVAVLVIYLRMFSQSEDSTRKSQLRTGSPASRRVQHSQGLTLIKPTAGELDDPHFFKGMDEGVSNADRMYQAFLKSEGDERTQLAIVADAATVATRYEQDWKQLESSRGSNDEATLFAKGRWFGLSDFLVSTELMPQKRSTNDAGMPMPMTRPADSSQALNRIVVLERKQSVWQKSQDNFARTDGFEMQVGIGNRADGVGAASAGLLLTGADKIVVDVSPIGSLRRFDDNSFAGFVIDFSTPSGFTKRVGLSFGFHSTKRWDSGPAWGTGNMPNEYHDIGKASKYEIDLRKYAPPSWDGKIWFTSQCQNAGRGIEFKARIVDQHATGSLTDNGIRAAVQRDGETSVNGVRVVDQSTFLREHGISPKALEQATQTDRPPTAQNNAPNSAQRGKSSQYESGYAEGKRLGRRFAEMISRASPSSKTDARRMANREIDDAETQARKLREAFGNGDEQANFWQGKADGISEEIRGK